MVMYIIMGPSPLRLGTFEASAEKLKIRVISRKINYDFVLHMYE